MEPYRPKRKDEVRVFPFKWFSTGFSGALTFFKLTYLTACDELGIGPSIQTAKYSAD